MFNLTGKIGMLWGFLIGAVIPLIPFLIIYAILKAKDLEMTDKLGSNLVLLMLGIDLLIVWRTMPKKEYEFFGRGLILAMFGYVIFWVANYAL